MMNWVYVNEIIFILLSYKMAGKEEIIIKTPQQIENIRKSGAYLNELLLIIFEKAQVWVSLMDLENIAESYISERGLKWAFKWYNKFPCNLCLSVNDCVVHGIPDHYVLKNGNVLKIDCGITYQWWISDSAVTKIIWWELANPLWYALAQATFNGLNYAIKEIWPDLPIVNYSRAMSDFMKKTGFSVIQKLTWHGVWVRVHEAPHIYNYPHKDLRKIFFRPGMVLAFEPITAITSTDFEHRASSRNLYCKNSDLGAHREYTILITENGYELLSWITDFLN